MTHKQLQDVIEHDFSDYKAQYAEHLARNPPTGRKPPRVNKDPDTLEFSEFKFIIEQKFDYLNKRNTKSGPTSPHDNIPIDIHRAARQQTH